MVGGPRGAADGGGMWGWEVRLKAVQGSAQDSQWEFGLHTSDLETEVRGGGM